MSVVQAPSRPVSREFRLIVLAAVAGLMAACASPPPAVTRAPATAQPSASAQSSAADSGTAQQQPAGTVAPPAPILPVPNGPQIASVPGPNRLPGPDTLLGLEGAQLEKLMGKPDFRRRDAPAELWQYAGPGCMLDAFLYADGKGESESVRVRYVEVRSRSVARVGSQDCYLGILRKRREAAGG